MKSARWIMAWIGLAAAGLLMIGPARADVQVRAEVDRTAVAPGESLQLTVTVEGGGGDVDVGALEKDFSVYSQGTGTSVRIVNGRTSRQTTSTYMLLPRREGSLVIPALSVRVDGKTCRTEPITISVGGKSADAVNADRDMWVEASVSEQSPFVGQQIIYTYRVCTTVQMNDANLQAPDFKDFSAKEIEKRKTYHRLVNGRDTAVTEVTYVLTPLSAGDRSIGPGVLQAAVLRQQRDRRTSPFDDFFFRDPFFNRGRMEQRVLKSRPITVHVQPLPPYTGQGEFSGLVGTFDLHSALDKNELKADDAATLSITVEGRGNIMDARAPRLDLPADFKSYSDTPTEDIHTDADGTSGRKTFRTALVPARAGSYTLPPVAMTYFDVAAKSYRTLNSQSLSVHVQAAPAAGDTAQALTIAAPPGGAPEKNPVAFTGRDILPPKEGLDALQPQRTLPLGMFLLWLAVPLICWAGVAAAQRMRRRDPSPAAIMKDKARRALKAAAAAAADRDAVLTHLYQALTAAILAAAGRTGEALTWKEAEGTLRQGGLAESEAHRTTELLKRIESAKFSGTPLSAADARELLREVGRTIRTLHS